MAKKPGKGPKRPAGRPVRRNPHARALGKGTFRERVVKGRKTYRRKPKHKMPPEKEEGKP